MLKVIQVVSDSNIGGAGKTIVNMLQSFDSRKIKSVVILPTSSKLISYLNKIDDVKVIELDLLNETSFNIKIIKEFRRIFLLEHPDIVHTHASISARIAAKQLGIKIVYTRHWLANRDTNFFCKVLNNYLCDKAIAVSNAVAVTLNDMGIAKKKISVVYTGVPKLNRLVRAQKKIIRKKYNLNDELVVGTVARLEEVKGLKYFIDAACIFLSYNPNAKFFIFGNGSLKDALHEYAYRIKHEDRIIFKETIDDLEEVVNLFDIFILSSLQEALSLALLEAMSVGTVCIATRCGGPCEIIVHRENGFLVPIENSQAIADAIKFLSHNEPLRKKISEQARKTIQNNFCVKRMADKIMQLYMNLVE
jgi:glycosyltransferase involved in cell wall biosynthesis